MKIGVGMSGGVDSTVTASLLQDGGHDVHGYFMLLPLQNGSQLLSRARLVANHLGITLHEIDLRQEFTQDVIRYFIYTYKSGRTPNPCSFCNPVIKFGKLRKRIFMDGCTQMATGHYAKIETTSQGTRTLRRGRDRVKDQSYFLSRLSAGQLENIVFPLGDFLKDDVRKMATEKGMPNGGDGESQDVCFLEGQSIADFLHRQGIENQGGEIVSTTGRVLGRHKGVFHYTIGQRRGLGIPDSTPWYVCDLNAGANQVIVDKKDGLYKRQMHLCQMQYFEDEFIFPWRGLVQIRSRHQAAEATVFIEEKGICRVEFDNPQLSITPGQFGVLYSGEQVMGSGEIL